MNIQTSILNTLDKIDRMNCATHSDMDLHKSMTAFGMDFTDNVLLALGLVCDAATQVYSNYDAIQFNGRFISLQLQNEKTKVPDNEVCFGGPEAGAKYEYATTPYKVFEEKAARLKVRPIVDGYFEDVVRSYGGNRLDAITICFLDITEQWDEFKKHVSVVACQSDNVIMMYEKGQKPDVLRFAVNLDPARQMEPIGDNIPVNHDNTSEFK